MAKEKSTDKEERKREKHSKKEKRSEKEGIHKVRKEKKGKKAAVAADETDAATTFLNTLEESEPGTVVVKKASNTEVVLNDVPLLGALVPFANPLADEKVQKKVLKGVKKGTQQSSLVETSCHELTKRLFLSGQEQVSQTWRQGSRQIPSQIQHRGGDGR